MVQNLVTVLSKNTYLIILILNYIYVYTSYLRKNIVLSLFKIDTLNFTVYI